MARLEEVTLPLRARNRYGRNIRAATTEAIARGVHDRWRAEQLGLGQPAASWSELDEPRREY